jgi:hypothetical protein
MPGRRVRCKYEQRNIRAVQSDLDSTSRFSRFVSPFAEHTKIHRKNKRATWQRDASSSSRQQPHSHRGRRGSPTAPHAGVPCATTTFRPLPTSRIRLLTPPQAQPQAHRAAEPMAPSPLLVRPPAPASSPLSPRRCPPAVAAAASVRAAPAPTAASPYSRLSFPPSPPLSLKVFVGTWFLLVAQAPYQVQVRRVGCQGGLLLHPDRYCR